MMTVPNKVSPVGDTAKQTVSCICKPRYRNDNIVLKVKIIKAKSSVKPVVTANSYTGVNSIVEIVKLKLGIQEH